MATTGLAAAAEEGGAGAAAEDPPASEEEGGFGEGVPQEGGEEVQRGQLSVWGSLRWELPLRPGHPRPSGSPPAEVFRLRRRRRPPPGRCRGPPELSRDGYKTLLEPPLRSGHRRPSEPTLEIKSTAAAEVLALRRGAAVGRRN